MFSFGRVQQNQAVNLLSISGKTGNKVINDAKKAGQQAAKSAKLKISYVNAYSNNAESAIDFIFSDKDESKARAFIADMKARGYNVEDTSDPFGKMMLSVISVDRSIYDKLNESSAIGKNIDCAKILTEAGCDVYRPDFVFLSEAAQLKVTDDVLTGMMKFITDKYNALDFGEIEKSAGDISRFKYAGIIQDNVETLNNIYTSSTDPGAKKYVDVCTAIRIVFNHLKDRRRDYADLYKSGNGVVQLLYTSLVAGCLYATGTLISNTIRFVTTEQNTDCQVMYDEIPGTIKHVHIKNILAASNDIGTFDKLLDEYIKNAKRPANAATNESVGAITTAILAIGAVILLVPRVFWLIREIIYSVYYTRVRISDMLQVQVDLINTNIESLESGRGNKKVIARQKKIADKLTKWQNFIAIKMDSTGSLVSVQKKQENKKLKIDENSPIVTGSTSYNGYASNDLML